MIVSDRINDLTVDVIVGPTASGKSALALKQAREDHSIEIVNADASLLYRGFDIGTAKPTQEELKEVTHHLIDILEPSETFSAAKFAKHARQIIRDIYAQGKKPLVVGGTGFYIDALFIGIPDVEIEEEKMLSSRNRYHLELEERGFDGMLKLLEPIDIELHEQIVRERNPRRLQRAWEFYYATGTPLGEARKQRGESFEYSPRFTVLFPERNDLHQRISERVKTMLASGWLDEVSRLLANGVTDDMPAMKAIGYKTLVEVIRNTISIDEAQEEIIKLTRQYAKRQMTWMKRYA